MTTLLITRDWEWECCGDDFALGSRVQWDVYPLPAGWDGPSDELAVALGPFADTLDGLQGHHGLSQYGVSGHVSGIHRVIAGEATESGEPEAVFQVSFREVRDAEGGIPGPPVVGWIVTVDAPIEPHDPH